MPLKWLWKHKIHLIIWGIFLAYMLTASQIYAAFILKNGKPLAGPVNLPEQTGEIVMHVDELRPTMVNGEEVYALSGWVYSPDFTDSTAYKKKLVLHSVTRDVVFEAVSTERKDLNKAMPEVKQDLTYAGFKVLIAKDVLRIENHKIGFLLEDDQGHVKVFRMVDQYIQRDPNRIRFIGGS